MLTATKLLARMSLYRIVSLLRSCGQLPLCLHLYIHVDAYTNTILHYDSTNTKNFYFRFARMMLFKPLQYYCSCLPVSTLLPMKKLLFWKKMLRSGNMILCRLAKCCDASIFALAAKFHLEPHDVVRSSITCKPIKHSFWFYFSKLV